jgi:hypothetical protein
MLEVTAVIDVDSTEGNGTEDVVKLFVDGELVGTAVTELPGNDFVNSDNSGFGRTGGSATGGRPSAEDSLPFDSGTIDYVAGLTLTEAPTELPPVDTMALSFVQQGFTSNVLDGTGKDTADAQFSLLADFDAFDDSSSTTPQAVFELGGAGNNAGLSLTYGTGNELKLMIRDGNSNSAEITYTLMPEQIMAGMMEVITIVDIDYSATEDLIQLLVDRELVGSASLDLAGNDFINSDDSAFGMTGGTDTGGWESSGTDAQTFTSGKINYAAGLWYSDNIENIETGWCVMANLDDVYPVDISDLAMMMINWLESPVAGLTGDLKKDGYVDMLDFSILASCWLQNN